MEKHLSCLERLCRICGKDIVNNPKSKSKAAQARVYSAEIKKLYNFDVDDDDKQIHPTNLCRPCTSRLQRCRRSVNFQPMQIEVADFEPHQGESCAICHQSPVVKTVKRGRPQKRKTGGDHGGPGRSHKKPVLIPASDQPSTSGSRPDLTIESVKRKLLSTETNVEEGIESTPEVDILSIPIDGFVEKDIAEHFLCTICQGVPTTPRISPCSHIFCSSCIQHWLLNSSACPSCREFLEDGDCLSLTGNNLSIYDNLRLRCIYSHLGCEVVSSMPNHLEHQLSCKYKGKGKRSTYGQKKIKQHLRLADKQYCKQKRLKPCFEFINEFCTTNAESKEDVLFFLLRSTLYDSGNREGANLVDDIWAESRGKLTVDECLALRVDNLQTKNSYRAQYDLFKDKSVGVLQPPSQLDELEKHYMPGTVRYAIIGEEHHEHIYQTPVKLNEKDPVSVISNSVEPVQLLSEFSSHSKEIPGPNLAGVRFRYQDAVAKTLHEIEPEVQNELEKLGMGSASTNLVLRTFIKDGSDGMGDVEIHKGKGERTLPANAFRASFAVVKSEIEFDGDKRTVFDQKNPNSVRCNRPLIEAIAEENCASTISYCLETMEAEKQSMNNRIIRIDCGSYWRCHYLVFLTSMVDEKLDRSAGGFQGAGSNYPCTLCDCTREEAVSKLGSFSINRTRDSAIMLAELRRVNPKQLSQNDMNEICKGVKKRPLLLSDPIDRGIDSTHANINLASFFKKLLVREIAEVTQWDKTADVKSILDTAEKQLDDHLKVNLGINRSLMLPGNYARTLFDEKNESVILAQIPKGERRNAFSAVLSKFRIVKKVYCAKLPLVELKEGVENVKKVAVEMGQLLIDNFGYAKWPNYLHKVIEHTQELITRDDGPGTIGGISGEGNEAGNKVFRHFRKHHSRKGSVIGGLRDTIWLHWLYSSPKLQRHGEVVHRKNRCSNCGYLGHNQTTCHKY